MTMMLSRRGVIAGGVSVLALSPLAGRVRPVRAEGTPPGTVTAYTRKVGDLELTAISDGYFELPASGFFINIAPEEVEAAAAAAFAGGGPQRLGVTAHLLRGGGRTILIDTGAGDVFGPTTGHLLPALAALGVTPEAVDAVLVTHMHPDHIGGLLAGGAAAFPRAAVHVSEADLAFWTGKTLGDTAPEEMKPMLKRGLDTATAYGDRVQTFAGEAEVLAGIASVPLPGHTVGHAGYRISSGGEEVIVFGDTASSAAVQFTHPEAGLMFDTDPSMAAETRRRFFDMAATDRLLVAGTHLPFPGLGHVARSGDAYGWVPEEWQYM